MRSTIQNVIIGIVTTGFLALSASSLPAVAKKATAIPCENAKDCPVGAICKKKPGHNTGYCGWPMHHYHHHH
jgi:hypothetical protein